MSISYYKREKRIQDVPQRCRRCLLLVVAAGGVVVVEVKGDLAKSRACCQNKGSARQLAMSSTLRESPTSEQKENKERTGFQSTLQHRPARKREVRISSAQKTGKSIPARLLVRSHQQGRPRLRPFRSILGRIAPFGRRMRYFRLRYILPHSSYLLPTGPPTPSEKDNSQPLLTSPALAAWCQSDPSLEPCGQRWRKRA